uniref:MER3 helicase-like winged helix domain-containing protein n=1 Tax=Glossina palpalis gambiensis TaxID=67801 RepID=A0A1B0AL97_9MUSC
AGEVSLISLVKLLIIDEHGERGPVAEALVKNTLRFVESSQSMIRIMGLSSTLPNCIDVANFLQVNPMKGFSYFDRCFRPVPLDNNFIGIKAIKPLQRLNDRDQVCYQKCIEQLQDGHQVMVFVHARNATVRTASTLNELAQQNNTCALFLPDTNTSDYGLAIKAIQKSRNKQLMELNRRRSIELSFRVSISTIPNMAHLWILVFWTHDKLNHYLSLLTNQFPIESKFIQCLANNHNAEIVLGTTTNVEEAIVWLSYTYLFVRMRINPHVYGIEYAEIMQDPSLE